MLVLFILPSALACISTEYRSSCADTDKYTLTLIPSEDCFFTRAVQYPSLDCKFECDPGHYEQVSNGLQSCVPCPAGSFSVSGSQYGGGGESWDSALNSLINDCWTKEKEYYIHYRHCGWETFDSFIQTQQAPLSQNFIATLSIPIQIVKPGSFSITYKKNTVNLNGKLIGTFSIFVNNEQVLEDNEIDQETWKYFQFELGTGMNEILIDYYTENNGEDPRAGISVLSITGSQFSDKGCYSCPAGGYKEGESSCEGCGANEYWNEAVCMKCPDNLYSLPGSVGEVNCKVRKECSDNDFVFIDSGCADGFFNQTPEWKQPIFCDYKNSQLPDKRVNLPCKECKAGYARAKSSLGETICVPCGNGQYSNNSTEGRCEACPGGTSSTRTLSIDDWSVLPKEFSSYCKHLDNSICKHSLGWLTNSSCIHTDQNTIPNTTLVLSRNILISSHSGKLTFDYSIIGQDTTILSLYINSVLHTNLNKLATKTSILLKQGKNELEFVYNVKEYKTEIVIYNFIIEGSDEGGALKCYECEDGHFSSQGQGFCQSCPAGQTSNSTKTGCEKCPFNFYSAESGQICQMCPVGTSSSYDKTNCYGNDFLRLNGQSYFIANITGVSNKGICRMPTTKFYCLKSFYGPLPGPKSDFYVSILNPDKLDLPNSEYLVSNSTGFAFLVINKNDSSSFSADVSENCIRKKQVINLGALAKPTITIANGFSISYINGDPCGENQTYSTSISILCDLSTGIGWPSFTSSDECSFNFVWNSKYGCPICKYEDMKTTRSECVNGIRAYKKVTGKNCILPFDEDIEWSESCSEYEDVIFSWQIMLGFSLVGILIIVGIISFLIYLKYKNGYDRLKDVSEKV